MYVCKVLQIYAVLSEILQIYKCTNFKVDFLSSINMYSEMFSPNVRKLNAFLPTFQKSKLKIRFLQNDSSDLGHCANLALRK